MIGRAQNQGAALRGKKTMPVGKLRATQNVNLLIQSRRVCVIEQTGGRHVGHKQVMKSKRLYTQISEHIYSRCLDLMSPK